ncbi:MAG: class I mannose-6-phosphate isomerase, partial [Clostridia bacterium]|nr:class I mannose-6-phosphate isomerase [Clostridia bacterium]
MSEPMRLSRLGKDYLWGGGKFNELVEGVSPLAEVWLCSAHPNGESVVTSGSFAGRTLASVIEDNPDFLGKRAKEAGIKRLPVLVKVIDAKEPSSVQVHPADGYARAHEGQSGKFEMWYVLSAEKDARIIYGLNSSVSEDELRKSAEDGTISRFLSYIPVRAGDVIEIPAGMIHGLGGGVAVLEISQNSDVTYRLYDYDRVGKDGEKRELRIDDALACADLSAAGFRPVESGEVRHDGYTEKFLCGNRYFKAERIDIDGAFPCLETSESFSVILCLSGEGEIATDGR